MAAAIAILGLAAPAAAQTVVPDSATKCASGVRVCQYIIGTNLYVSSWTSTLWQYPSDKRVCNPTATFVVAVGSGIYEYRKNTFSGCKTASAGSSVMWTTKNVCPCTFADNATVSVWWEPFGISTPTALIYKKS